MLDEMYFYANSIPRKKSKDPLENFKTIVELAKKIHSIPKVADKNSKK